MLGDFQINFSDYFMNILNVTKNVRVDTLPYLYFKGTEHGIQIGVKLLLV